MDYNVTLDIFEGPLDLLLHLIKKNEVDIYDIPIAKITEQYLEYLELIKSLSLDIAGEFLLMATTLLHIKSKTLLPATEDAIEDEDEDFGDPREELIRRLLEYKRYKDAAQQIKDRNLLGRDVFVRGELPREDLEFEEVLESVSIFALLEALQTVLKKIPKPHLLDMSTERFNIMDKINDVMALLAKSKSTAFFSLFPQEATKGEIIVTFLAILELSKLRMLRIHQSIGGNIRVYLPDLNISQGL